MPGIAVMVSSAPLNGGRKVSEKFSVSLVGLTTVALAAGVDDTSLTCAAATPGRASAKAARRVGNMRVIANLQQLVSGNTHRLAAPLVPCAYFSRPEPRGRAPTMRMRP